MSLDLFRAASLAGVPHGFFGRRGGVSSGSLASLNCGPGSGDDPANIAENRARAIALVLPGAKLATPYQVHSAVAVQALPWPDAERPRADALVTERAGLLLGVVTADCAPLLLADTAAGVVGAVHAGWRGAIGGVAEAAIAAMERLGAQRKAIVAALGPCIAQGSYEVDEDFRSRFLADDRENARWFVDGPAGKPQFDLAGYVAGRLEAAGIASIERIDADTYADEQRLFSYRRSSHRGEPGYGRQLSLIGLPGEQP